MTTEVAVLNKLAIALAADSAATIDTGGSRKVYNSANKIFDLSDSQPLGLMIYGNLEFMGLPFEGIVKDFRSSIHNSNFPTVSACMERFKDFLVKDVKVDPDDEFQLAFGILNQFYSQLNSQITNRVTTWLSDAVSAAENGGAPPKLEDAIARLLKARLKLLRREPPADCYKNRTPQELFEYFKDQHTVITDEIVRAPRNDEVNALLEEITGELFYRSNLSPLLAGVVIAGFGCDERCPSLSYMEIDGVLSGSLKCLDKPFVDIGRRSKGAEILAFAQSDVAEMFLTGLLPSEEEYILRVGLKINTH